MGDGLHFSRATENNLCWNCCSKSNVDLTNSKSNKMKNLSTFFVYFTMKFNENSLIGSESVTNEWLELYK